MKTFQKSLNDSNSLLPHCNYFSLYGNTQIDSHQSVGGGVGGECVENAYIFQYGHPVHYSFF